MGVSELLPLPPGQSPPERPIAIPAQCVVRIAIWKPYEILFGHLTNFSHGSYTLHMCPRNTPRAETSDAAAASPSYQGAPARMGVSELLPLPPGQSPSKPPIAIPAQCTLRIAIRKPYEALFGHLTNFSHGSYTLHACSRNTLLAETSDAAAASPISDMAAVTKCSRNTTTLACRFRVRKSTHLKTDNKIAHRRHNCTFEDALQTLQIPRLPAQGSMFKTVSGRFGPS